ncbi:MAG: hypothetical protein Q4P29_07355 [Tissierellia bacterium]|nr:hypothetical protein [Tissierellia bacterium]
MIENTAREYFKKRNLEDVLTDEESKRLNNLWPKLVEYINTAPLREKLSIQVKEYIQMADWLLDVVEKNYHDIKKPFRVIRDKEYLDTGYRPILKFFMEDEVESVDLKGYAYRYEFYKSVKSQLEEISFNDLFDELLIIGNIYKKFDNFGSDIESNYEIYLDGIRYEEYMIGKKDFDSMKISEIMPKMIKYYPQMLKVLRNIDAKKVLVFRSSEIKDFGYKPIVNIYHENKGIRSDLPEEFKSESIKLKLIDTESILAELNLFSNIYL